MVEMKKLLLITLLIILYPYQGIAMNNKHTFKSLPYPTIKTIYFDCKSAIGLANNDTSKFLHTGCARQINGFYNAMYLFLASVQPPTHDINNKFLHIKEQIYNELNNIICLPNEITTSGDPLELSIAKDLVNYIQNKYQREDNIPNTYNSREYRIFEFGSIIADMYKCKKKE